MIPESSFYCMWVYQKQQQIRDLMIWKGMDENNLFEFNDFALRLWMECPELVEMWRDNWN